MARIALSLFAFIASKHSKAPHHSSQTVDYFPDGGPGTEPDSLVKQTGTIAAAQYAVERGLSVPQRSSIYRGILESTETAAASVFVADVYVREYQGFKAEISSHRSGGCH